ncbi:unnamed protein product, partial [Allacma fusca]
MATNIYDTSTRRTIGRTSTKGSIMIGVLTPEDARLAYDHGAKGVLVSNHGGRQIDGTISS